MTKLARRTAILTGTLVVAVLAFAPIALAGDYHTGSGLRCSDCHIMHGSKDGVTYGPGGNGFDNLLKTSTTGNALCMSCHDGTDTNAPDVVATGDVLLPANTTDLLGISYASKYKNSAGYFQSDWASRASDYGHNLAGGPVTAIQGDWTSGAGSTGMNCTDCHSAHGTANYRNLRVRPGTAGGDVQIRGGTTGAQEVYLREAITVPADAGNTATHYDTSAVAFNDPNNIVLWCVGCHTRITTGEKHPQNEALSSPLADGAHWLAGTGAGFGTDVGDTERGIPRVRFAQAGASYADCGVVATTDKVFCLSCHKAHGSKYDSSILWPHFTRNAADRPAACNQCHNKGL